MNKNKAFSRFYALLAKMPGAEKEELVWNFSNMRTASLREFFAVDQEGFLSMLETLNNEAGKLVDEGEANIRKLRSAVLKRIQQIGVDTTSWAMVNRYLEQPRIAGKRLYELKEDELRKLVRKLESIKYKEMEKSEKERSIAQMN